MAEITGSIDVNVLVKTPLFFQDTALAVAPQESSTQNHAPGSPYAVRRITCSALGRAKFDIRFGPLGSESTIAVVYSSMENPTTAWVSDSPLPVSAVQNIQIIRTNLDSEAIDISTTIQAE